jgi:hypothetical protein
MDLSTNNIYKMIFSSDPSTKPNNLQFANGQFAAMLTRT